MTPPSRPPVKSVRQQFGELAADYLVCPGRLAARYPRGVGLLITAITIIMALAIMRVETDDALSGLFNAQTQEYRNYEQLTAYFPSNETDLLIAVDGWGLTTSTGLEAVRDLHLELSLLDSVEYVISLFSIRDRPDERGRIPPFYPIDLPDGAELEALLKRAYAHPIVRDQLLSDPQESAPMALIVVTLSAAFVEENGLETSIGEIRPVVRDILKPVELRHGFTGIPKMKLETLEDSRRDRLVFTALAYAICVIVCLFYFRRLRNVAISTLPPLVAAIWVLGTFGIVGIHFDPLTNTIIPLAMAIAFTDSMHLQFAVQREISAGAKLKGAVNTAVRDVGPACGLTSITTAIALLSLTLTDSELIRTFGAGAALATTLAFAAVIAANPVLTMLLFDQGADATDRRLHHVRDSLLDRSCIGWANILVQRSGTCATVGLVFTAGAAIAYAQLQPHYRLSDLISKHREAATTSARLEARLSGVYPLDISVEWLDDKTFRSPEVVDTIAGIHGLLETVPAVENIWSLETLRRWLGGTDGSDRSDLDRYINQLPDPLRARFVNESRRAALIASYTDDLEAKDVLDLVDRIEAGLAEFRSKYPELELTVTGIAALSASHSVNIIEQLNYGLFGAVLVIIALLGIVFGSFRIMLLSAPPNLFALLATGGLLHLGGAGLSFANVVGLTVAFGLAVDDTIHLLNRMRLERARGLAPVDAVKATVHHVGPVLVLTTTVLVLGLSVTVLSSVPLTLEFGRVCIATLVFALIGDLVLLPAMLLQFGNGGEQRQPHRSTSPPT